MKFGLSILAVLVLWPAVTFSQTPTTVPLSRSLLKDDARFFGSQYLVFTEADSTRVKPPRGWSRIETATIVDNPRVEPTTIARYRDAAGQVQYALSRDGGLDFDSAIVLQFHKYGDKRIADCEVKVRLIRDASKKVTPIACKIELDKDKAIARLAECREGVIAANGRVVPVRLQAPSINDPFYTLSSEAALMFDENNDGNFAVTWSLSKPDSALLPAEKVNVQGPFMAAGRKFKAAGVDSAGTMLVLDDFAGDTALAVGFKTPDFGFIDLSGGQHRFSDYRGKVVLVTFLSTTCSFCEKMRPSMLDFLTQADTTRLAAVASFFEPDVAKIEAFWAKHPYGGLVTPNDRALWEKFNKRGSTPVYYVIDQTGTLRITGSGASFYNYVERVIRELMKKG